jgi:hypothetical protein
LTCSIRPPTMDSKNSTIIFSNTVLRFPQIEELSIYSPHLQGFALGAVLLYLFCKYTYRIYFHPLSKIPGPTLAAATHLYQAYHNFLGHGYNKLFIPMHKSYSEYSTLYISHSTQLTRSPYSPVIRIATDHVHIGDPKYYHT